MIKKYRLKGSEHQIDVREGHIDVAGGGVWYRMMGCNKSEIPLLIVHGGPGASHDYLEPLAALSDERPVIFYDQLGCGRSDRPSDPSLWNLERYVDELTRLISVLGLRKTHILGQSWGAALAAEYVLTKQPYQALSLILSGPLLSASRWMADQKTYIGHLPEQVRSAIRRAERTKTFDGEDYQKALMVYYREHVCRMETWPDCLKRSFDQLNIPLYQYMWGPSEFTVTGTLKHYERVGQLKQLDLPVLFTCGEFDEATPATTSLFHQQVPGSQLHVFADASHEHHLEQTMAYLDVLRAFMSTSEAQSA